ncbi:unnamed protein product [Acanthoscelides obtectus]|uniref:Uncharacterized protein n=1 Tax=Acanthoscelides obtectus TaxID=200917 RepID=A0A9P0LL13_ACAOB|nr:unnamed protein product [Acanthoscelides obtectus]
MKNLIFHITLECALQEK